MTAHTRTPPPRAFDALEGALGYWWTTCGGLEIVAEFQAAPESVAWHMIERYPALLLPEIAEAAARVLGPSRALDGLREMHEVLRGSPAYASYHRLLVAALAGERRGSRRTNLERALLILQDVRRTAADPADEATERSLRDALAALRPREAMASTLTDALFLDDRELAGFRRRSDHRQTNPHRHDRAFASLRGLAAGSSEWLGDPAAAVYALSDARWVFASTKAAKTYLDTPGTLLLSRDGLERSALLALGDGAYAWEGAPGTTGRQCLLFRVGRVVARIHVTEGPRAADEMQKLKRALVLPYAEAAVQRIRHGLAQYWLAVGRGLEAADQLRQAPPRKADLLLAGYPVLLLPEFPTAMASLGPSYVAAAERLAVLQGTARTHWQVYRETLRALVRGLLDEPAGEPRVNVDAAIRLVSAHRRLDADPSWAALEAECQARDDRD